MSEENKPDPVADERARNIVIGEGLLMKNTRDCIVIYSSDDGGFFYTTNSRTWAMGAIKRTAASLDERERLDTRRSDEQGEL